MIKLGMTVIVGSSLIGCGVSAPQTMECISADGAVSVWERADDDVIMDGMSVKALADPFKIEGGDKYFFTLDGDIKFEVDFGEQKAMMIAFGEKSIARCLPY